MVWPPMYEITESNKLCLIQLGDINVFDRFDINSFPFAFKNFFLHLFVFERQRQSTSAGRAEIEGDKESQAGSRL